MAIKSGKRVLREDDLDDFVAPDDETTPPPTKKARKSTTSSTSNSAGAQKDSEGNTYWDISKQRRVTITTFAKKTLVNVREYYEKDGKDLPGKKGIAMSMEQYCALVKLLPDIEKVLKEKGEKDVPRPDYGGASSAAKPEADEEDEDEEEEDVKPSRKANIEATSDEDEGAD